MAVHESITTKLRTSFEPEHLEVINESSNHNVPKGAETHFKVIVIAGGFAGKPPLARHRLVNDVLAEELANGVHALSIIAKTPEQWAKAGGVVAPSPPCLGGSGR